MAFTALWGGVSLLIPNQVQLLEFAQFFTGADAHIDLVALTRLKDQVAAGSVIATQDQQRLLDILAGFDASRAQSLALITSIGVGGTMIIQPIVGVLSDRTRSRFGRRAPWMIFGALVGSAFLVGVRFAPTVAILAVLWTFAQVIINMGLAPLGATLADRVPENQRGTISAIGGFGAFVGGVLGSVCAGIAFATVGLNSYYVFAATIVLFAMIFVFRVKDRSSVELAVPEYRWSDFFRGLIVALRGRDFRWVWVARILLTFGYGVSTALSFFMLQSYVRPALSAAEATALAPVLTLVGMPGTVLAIVIAGRLSDKLGRRKIFVIVASVLMAVSMAIPLVSTTIPALIAQGILGGIAFGIYMPVDQALLVDVLPDMKSAGRDLGIAGLATNLGQALGPVLAGQIVALSGGYTLVWVAALVLVAVAAVAIVPVRAR
ncbi:MFS transporter [Nonomuraea sp. NPDC026600]|uniref:MFS transporter n=1 Tax=Nonomuraea sp. NPDC026600 TaxID=3155363 RepID=UPI0033C64B85